MTAKKRKDSVSIRIAPSTKAVMDAIAARIRATKGKKGRITNDDVIWYLVEQAEPEVAEEFRGLSEQSKPSDDSAS